MRSSKRRPHFWVVCRQWDVCRIGVCIFRVRLLKRGTSPASRLLPSGWIRNTVGTILSHVDEGNNLGKREQPERKSLGPGDSEAAELPSHQELLFVAVHLLSCVRLIVTPWTMACQASLSQASLHGMPCPSLSPGVCPNSCSLSQWCYLTISSFATPPLLLPSVFPSIKVFPVSQLFTSNGQSLELKITTLANYCEKEGKCYTD